MNWRRYSRISVRDEMAGNSELMASSSRAVRFGELALATRELAAFAVFTSCGDGADSADRREARRLPRDERAPDQWRSGPAHAEQQAMTIEGDRVVCDFCPGDPRRTRITDVWFKHWAAIDHAHMCPRCQDRPEPTRTRLECASCQRSNLDTPELRNGWRHVPSAGRTLCKECARGLEQAS